MAVITISRFFGAGGRTLGERLAVKLGYRYVNEEMIKEVAAKAGMSPEGVHSFEKSAGSKLMRFLDKLVRLDYLDRIIQNDLGYLNEERYVHAITEIIKEISAAGNAVVIGRGGQYILADRPDVYHIGLVADDEFRRRFVMNKYACTYETADRAISRADQERNLFLKLFSDRSHPNDPRLYHLIINTSRTGLDVAEKLILELIEFNQNVGA